MTFVLTLVVAIACIIGISLINNSAIDSPNICKNCKKEYDKAEKWGFTEYMWGLRCPHCKHEFDI